VASVRACTCTIESRLPTLARSALWSESELARAKITHPTLAQLLPEFFATPQQ
jgi:hypothetical protein